MHNVLHAHNLAPKTKSAEDDAFAVGMDVDGSALIDLSGDPEVLDLCDQARADIEAFGSKDLMRIQDLWQRSTAVRNLAILPQVVAPLEAYFGRRAIPFQTLNFKFGSQQKAHSDLIHFTPDPIEFMCGVWFALEDVHDDAGPLEYFPGSHKWPVLTMEASGAPVSGRPDAGYNDFYVPAMEAQIAQHDIMPRRALIKKGQAFVWAANLVHGGSLRRDESKTRFSQVTHFFFEDCTYHTLMFQRGAKRKIRLPLDIRTGRFAQPVLRPGDHLPLRTKLRVRYQRFSRVTPSW